MTRLNVAIDKRDLQRARDALTPAQFTRAARSAVNETIRSGITEISKLVRQEITLPAKVVKERLRPKLAKDSLDGAIIVSRKAVPLIEYGARQTKKGVTVKTRKGGPRELLKSTFIARMKSGHEGVFERRAKAGRGKSGPRVGRLKIDERFGPTVIGVIAGKPGLLEEAQRGLAEKLIKRFSSKVDYILSGGKVGRDPKREET